jgi:phosphatidylserine/phosphatidylglycerophosphate/cardiolipin synthase-like enzyme
MSPVGILPRFDHEKYWITLNPLPDGDRELRVILGGLNIASEYAYGGTPQRDAITGRRGWRDTDIELRGPITNDVVSRYLDLIEIHTSERLLPGERGRLNPTQGVKGAPRRGLCGITRSWATNDASSVCTTSSSTPPRTARRSRSPRRTSRPAAASPGPSTARRGTRTR